jgi:hypothetical protein
MKQVINNFVEELQNRVSILSSMNNNLDSSKVDKLNKIITKYDGISSDKFTKTELKTVSEILKIDLTDKINYSELDKSIKDYLDEFNTVKDTHDDFSSNEIKTYNKYIELLTSNKLDKVFTKFSELDELMSELGLSVKDKWKIISYINDLNIKSKEDSIYNINLNSKLVIYTGLYLNNEDLNKTILKNIKDISIDIDMIPSLAKKITTGKMDITKVQNALATIILNELYQQLLETKDEDSIKNLQEMVELTMQYIDSYEDKIIKPAEEVIVLYEDLLNEQLEQGKDINEYVDVAIEDIDEDRTKAINLKALPIIKSIKETLNNLYKCDKASDEYIEYLNLLTSLNNAYKEVKEV